jgi:Prealbumin-like fold domain
MLLAAIALGAFLMLWGQTAVAEESPAPEALSTETVSQVIEEDASTTDGAFIFADEGVLSPVTEEETPQIVEAVVGEVVIESEISSTGTPPPAAASDVIAPEPAAAPEVWSEKEDYRPGETATIFGRFFSPLSTFMIKVFGSDENEQNYTETEAEVATDDQGSFSFAYLLDSLYRPFYEVVVSTFSGEKVAETWFRDLAVGAYDQCSNDDGEGYSTGNTLCRWVTGNLVASNSTYTEGDATVQRVWLEGLNTGSEHSITLKYGTTKGGKHAYDFLTNWDWSESYADICEGITNCTGTNVPIDLFPIPVDPNAGGFDAAVRNMTLYGGEITSITTPTKVSGNYTGDSETSITVNFTVDPADNGDDMCVTGKVQGKDVTSCGVALFFGAHISKGSEWGVGSTAVDIPGSPYHVALDAVDGSSAGQRDNQMQAEAVTVPAPTGSIVIIKDTVPNDAEDFAFTTTGGLSNFSLDDDDNAALSNTQTFTDLADGVYSVTELATAGFDLTNLACTDASGGTTVQGSTASIDLSGGETVTCTYTNTKRGSITIVKNTVGGDGTFNYTGNTGVSQLVTTNGSANQTVSNVVPGTYTIAETVPTGWSLTSATCDADETIGSIDVGPGEHVTCTFTNTKDATLTLVKTVTNNNGGTATAADFQAKIDGNDVAWGTPITVSAGSHTASEVTLPTYAASSWGGACAANGSVTLAAGESKTCTITNDDIAPKLHLRKVVVNDNGGEATAADFTLTANGTDTNDLSGVSPVDSGSGLIADTFTLSETSLSGYAASAWVCTGAGTQNGASITLGLGEEATCTITNDDIAPQLTVIKHVINDDGGTKVASDFIMNVTATAASNDSFAGSEAPGTTITLDAGTYSVDEVELSGYTKSLGANCSGTIEVGQTKTCTITNDDQSGTLVVHKVTDPVDTTTPFTITASADSGVVEGVAEQSIAGGETETYTVHAGVYDVSESVQAGWDMTGNTCVNVAVGNGETVHCTITNTEKGHLIVEKTTLPAGDVTSFAITATGDGTITGGGAGSVTDATDKDYEVTPGTYSVSETVPAGWDMTGNTCVGVVVAAGETKTCTITNTKRGSIIIQKNAIPDSTQAFTFNNNFGNNNPATFILADTDAVGLPSYVAEVIPGKYAVTEDDVIGWQLRSATCNSRETVDDLDVDPGETVTCTFTNDKQAKLVLVKNTVGGNGTFDFALTGSGLPATDSITTENNTGSTSYEYLNPDLTFSLTETPIPAGWEKTSAVCDNGDPVTAIAPDSGDVITCTFTNAKLPTLTLEKTVVNDNGGEAVAADFTPSINATPTTWGTVVTLTPGNYTATETSLFGYTAGDWGGACAKDGTVSLAYGENKVCSITNDDVAPKLTVIKQVVNDNGGNDVAADFTMQVTGENVSEDSFAGSESGVTVTLDAGAYSVDEAAHIGYTKSLGAGCSGSIAVGEEKTCTIINNDQPASITLTKVVTNNNGGTAGPQDFGLTIGGVAATSGQTYEVDSNTAQTLNEVGYTGYSFVSLTGDAKCPAVLGGTVTLNEGERVSCTITNDDIPANLIVIKHVDNGVTGGTAVAADFTTTITGVTTTNQSAAGAEAPGVLNVLTSVGAYSVDEGAHVGYAKTLSADCAGTIALGETKTCTITNTAIAPKLTVIKVVDNGNTGATYTAADFQMKVDGSNVPQNSAQTQTVGLHTVTEAGPAGYSAAYSGECNEDGEVTLALAEEKTCTITNTAIAPKLTLVKTVVNDDGGTKQVADFPLSIDTTSVVSGVAQVVTVGAHTAQEVSDAGYVASDWGGACAADGTVSLALGEEKTCTITNDDKPGKIEIIKNTIGGNDTFNFTVAGPSASTQEVTTVANTGTTGVFEVNAGAYSIAEVAKLGWDLASSSCSTGTPAQLTIANGETVTCTFTNTKRATVTIVKDAQPNDVQDFTFTSAALGGFTLDDDANVVDPADGELLGELSNSQTFTNVLPGVVTVTEAAVNQYWKLIGATCVVTGTSEVVASTLTGSTLSVNAAPGADITCTFVNEKLSPTRTQGFWQTHTAFTSEVFTSLFATSGMKIGTTSSKITTAAQLFGAWYANIAKKTDGKQRTALDKARMSLLQQLVTAKLNCAQFGCPDAVKTMIANADTAFAGETISAITAATGQLDIYNNSGDTIIVGNTGKATPKTSNTIANKLFWNTLP